MFDLYYSNILQQLIALLKKIKKRIFRIKKSEIKSVIYNIEGLKYENYILTIDGWVFNKDRKIDNATLFLIHGKQEYRVCNLNKFKKRLDVYNVYKNKNSIYSGFSLKVRIKNGSNILIYLELDNKERILLNKVKSSLMEKLRFYKKKFTIQNVRKAIKLLRKQEFLKLNESMQKIEIQLIDEQCESIDFLKFSTQNLVKSIHYSKSLYECTIDIIIPIYNGYEYLHSLFDSITKTKMSYRLILINDNSTDIRVKEFLKKYENKNEIILIENETNLGFVKTVNKAFSIANNNIALLNTDIELPEMWLERLMTPIILNADVASSTPFTNCGTICSFPQFFKDNDIFEKMDLDTIDNTFKSIKPNYTSLPTGIGFCMGIKKEVLNKVGFFDSDTFGKGYGEENDWCQRAKKAGYKNVHIENLFVYHKHGGSFLNEEKKELIKSNSILLEKKHPNFNVDVVNFCNEDPAKNIRTYVTFKLLSHMCDGIKVYFDHNIGGGATMYLEKEIDNNIANGESSLIIRYDAIAQNYLFNYKYKSYDIAYYFMQFEDIIDILYKLKVKNIYINELVTYPNVYDTLEKLSELKKKKNINITMLLHDFYSICPTINLLNDKGYYCNIANIDECEKCIKKNDLNTYYNYESITKWRGKWAEFLNKCDNIIVFSESSKKILQKSYDLISNITIIPHKVDYILPLKKYRKSTSSLNIGLLGTLNHNKGLDKVKKMLHLIQKLGLNVNIILVGSAIETIKHKNFKQTGKYTLNMIHKLVIENDIDLFFISSIWPETFSYTTQEIINMEFPIVSFNLGAQADKIKEYDKGLVLKNFDEKDILYKIIEFSKQFNYEKLK